jgi:hypothetical protein
MIKINFKNVEELLLTNNSIKNSFPEFKPYFDQIERSKHYSFMKQSAIQAKIDLVNHLNERHIQIIENHLNQSVEIVKFNNNFTQNYSCKIDEFDLSLNSNLDLFCIYRNKDVLKVTFFK